MTVVRRRGNNTAFLAYGPESLKLDEGGKFSLEIVQDDKKGGGILIKNPSIHLNRATASFWLCVLADYDVGTALAYIQIGVPNLVRVSKVFEYGGTIDWGYGYFDMKTPEGIPLRVYICNRRCWPADRSHDHSFWAHCHLISIDRWKEQHIAIVVVLREIVIKAHPLSPLMLLIHFFFFLQRPLPTRGAELLRCPTHVTILHSRPRNEPDGLVNGQFGKHLLAQAARRKSAPRLWEQSSRHHRHPAAAGSIIEHSSQGRGVR